MGFWADLTETPWNREIKLLKEKLAESEERNRKLKERSSRLTAELDKIKGDLRASEHSELTLRGLKHQLEVMRLGIHRPTRSFQRLMCRLSCVFSGGTRYERPDPSTSGQGIGGRYLLHE